jgi:uncharacterized protein with GYD domain
MPTYIMISTLTPEGVQTVKNNPNRIKEVNRELEQIGAKVTAQWATLGRFDFVNVVEAPDEKTMAKVSLELGSRGTAHYESLPEGVDAAVAGEHCSSDPARLHAAGHASASVADGARDLARRAPWSARTGGTRGTAGTCETLWSRRAWVS